MALLVLVLHALLVLLLLGVVFLVFSIFLPSSPCLSLPLLSPFHLPSFLPAHFHLVLLLLVAAVAAATAAALSVYLYLAHSLFEPSW